jgi:hypothetical protein
MALDTAKEVRVMFDLVAEQYEEQTQMAKLVGHYNMTGANAQNSNNVEWRQVEQQAPEVEGWEFVDADFGSVIEQSFPTVLGVPKNSLFQLRADDFRDRRFMERRATAGASRLSSGQNKRIADLVKGTGSIFYRTSTAGYDFVKTASTIMSERQLATDAGTSFFVNDRTAQRISSDLANRTAMGKLPEETYKRGMIASQTAGFDIYESSYLSAITGGATPAVATVTTTVSQGPVANQTLGGIVLPVDYRLSDLIAFSGANAGDFAVGDRIKFTGVNSIGLADKSNTGQEMTFVIRVKSGSSYQVYPRPIAFTDGALSVAQKAYANIATQITATTPVVRLNVDATASANAFWVNDSIEIVDGDAPLEFLGQKDGMQVLVTSLASGTKLYMAYQGSINDLTLKCRLFTWYDVVNKDPSRNGISVLSA